MKVTIPMTLVGALCAGVCVAESFYLEHPTEDRRYGPFQYKEGGIVTLGRVALTIRRESKPMALKQRMERTVIPEMDFRQAHIADIVDFLRAMSVEYGPDKSGVNFIMKPAVQKAAAETLVTFRASALSLPQALDAVTGAAGLSWRIEGNIVWIETR